MPIKVPSVFEAIDKFSKPVERMERTGVKFADKLGDGMARTNRVVDRLTPSLGSMGNQLLGLAGIAGGVALADKMIDIQQRTEAARVSVRQFTGETGTGLDKITAKVQSTANIFDQDFNEVLVAANTLSKQMGIGFDDAITRIQEGFIGGANNSGELLAIVKEYPVFMKEAGLSANAFFNVLDQQVKQGIYSDKGIDAIKEANIRLREAPKATIDALDGIGLSSSKLLKGLKDGSLTTFDVMQKVSKRLSELPANSQAVGTAIADIFGGAGEDAGLKFLTTIQSIDKAQNQVTKGFTATEKTQNKLLQANTKLELAYNKLFGGTNAGIIELKAGFMNLVAEGIMSVAPEINNIIKTTTAWLSENGSTIMTIIKVFLVYVGVLKAIKIATATVRAVTVAYNIALGISNALQGKSLILSRSNMVAMKAQVAVTKGAIFAKKSWVAITKVASVAARAFSIAISANPIGAIVLGIVALGFAIRSMLKNWEKWGRIVALLSGPLGVIIFIIKEIADNWDKVTAAFKEGGILGAIKAIGTILKDGVIKAFDGLNDKVKVVGATLLKFFLKPLEFALKLLSKVGVGQGALESLQKFQGVNQAFIDKTKANIAAEESGESSPVNLQATQNQVTTERSESVTRGELGINIQSPQGVDVDESSLNGIPVTTQQTFQFE